MKLLYAIVDIETTGGHAQANGITEIAIVLYDGINIEGKFHALINPGIPVPRYISSLTGITNEMLYDKPAFSELAGNIFNLLQGRIFVAHNVNFDYSFIKYHLAQSGYDLNCKKLCTVRLSRKIFPGFARYNLRSICQELGVVLENAHRAFGDAAATSELFAKLLKADTAGHISLMLKGKNKEQYLPPYLPSEQVEQLPALPGVYYFHDSKGKVIYVGKANNLVRRVKSHFANNQSSRRKQDFLKHIYSLSYKVCGTELMALLLENVEIRRLWPLYNRSQKQFTHTYGLYSYTCQKGYDRLIIEKKKNRIHPYYTFSTLQEGYILIRKLVKVHQLHPAFCYLDKTGESIMEEAPSVYNERVQQAITSLQTELPSFALIDPSRHSKEQACVLIERGQFYGMGNLPDGYTVNDLMSLKEALTPYPDSEYIRGLVFNHVHKYPHTRIELSRV